MNPAVSFSPITNSAAGTLARPWITLIDTLQGSSVIDIFLVLEMDLSSNYRQKRKMK